MPSAQDRYRLGRDCTIAVDGVLLAGVADVGVRRVVSEVDATGYLHNVKSAIVTHRTYELDLEVLRPADVARLRDAENRGRVVTVTTTNGLREFTANFTVHESSADEPINDGIRARFTLKQWGHAKP